MDLRDLGKLTSQVDIDTISSSNLTNLDVLATIGNNLQSWDNVFYLKFNHYSYFVQ